MQIRCFRFQEQGTLQPTEEQPTSAWLQDGVIRWLDIDYSEPTQQLREVLAPFDLDSDLFEEIESQDRGVDVQNFQHALFLRIPRPARTEFPDPYVSIVCVKGTLISLHRGILVDQEAIAGKLVRLGAAGTTTIAELVLYILMSVVEWDIRFYQETRRTIDELSSSVDQHCTDHVLDDIRGLSNRVGRLQSVTEDRIILTAALLAWKSPLFDWSDVRQNVQEIHDVLKQLQRWLENLEKRLQGLSQHYNLSLQEATNTRLRVLTVISAIFMPLTLIAGIYGMNFQGMPELQEPYAYFIVLGFMALLGGGLGVWFYVRGWFG